MNFVPTAEWFVFIWIKESTDTNKQIFNKLLLFPLEISQKIFRIVIVMCAGWRDV